MKQNKKSALLKALKRGWLTPLEAAQRVGLFSLSQRCGEFRRAGVNVLDKWVTTDGGSRVKAYRVAGG
ncbi:helix-turn-helix domain-containing protein [Methylibium sp.]|uniref:helix-turn-helix domain-containing protein n=1 Tax=Methylibium sp. TaxID=2067992 RepID=UPI001830481D|nr:helix-turn-helix domain-containing protein [Methylibium sp.]MBA3590357.1 hypothetical protein [Methylibium sp.]